MQLLKTDWIKFWHTMDSHCRQSLLFFAVFLASLPSGADSQCEVLSRGGYIERTLHITETVCDVMHTAIIAKDHTLHLRPGVKLRFAPGVMLAINGTLIAQVDKANGLCMLLVCLCVMLCKCIGGATPKFLGGPNPSLHLSPSFPSIPLEVGPLNRGRVLGFCKLPQRGRRK